VTLASNPRYQALSAAREQIMTGATKRVPEAAMASQARALRLWTGKTLFVRNDPQLNLLFDLAVFDPVGGHSRALDRELRARQDPPGSEAAQIAAAAPEAAFTLFVVEEENPQGGVMARDLLRENRFTLWDGFLSRPELRGCAFAGRLMQLPEAAMTCIATCPITDEIMQVLQGFPPPQAPPPKFLPPLTPLEPAELAVLREAATAPGFAPKLFNAALDLGLFGERPDR
jgi:hypothetical protein